MLKQYRTILDNMRLPMVEEVRRHKIDAFGTAEDVASASRVLFGNAAEEHLWVFCMGPRLKVIGAFEASVGAKSYSILDPSVIFRNALLLNASAIILCHNHPTGDCTPSAEDVEGTKRMVAAGNLINVPVLDHVIIGNGWVSLKERGAI